MNNQLIEWVVNNPLSLIALGISIASILLYLWEYKLHKRVYLLRPHSDRLSEIFARWISSSDFCSKILDTTFEDFDHPIERLKEDFSKLERQKELELPSYALEHLKTGYAELHEKIINFREKVRTHNKKVYEYVLSQCNKLKNTLNLPDRRGENKAYYGRIIIYVSTKILFNQPESDPYVSMKEAFYFLKWGGADLIISKDEHSCRKGLQLIEEMIEKEANKIKQIRSEADKLRQELQKLREDAHTKLVDFIKLGALVKGECDVCKEM